MNVLLFSMPSFVRAHAVLCNAVSDGALASLAGNVDAHHDVAVADLVWSSMPCRRPSASL